VTVSSKDVGWILTMPKFMSLTALLGQLAEALRTPSGPSQNPDRIRVIGSLPSDPLSK